MERTEFKPARSDKPGQNLQSEIRRLIKESAGTQDSPARSMEFCKRAVSLAEQGGPGRSRMAVYQAAHTALPPTGQGESVQP